MRVITQSPDPLAGMQTMTKTQGKSGAIDVKALVAKDEEFLRALVRAALQEVLEAEMTEALAPRRASGPRAGWATGVVITAEH
jgi:transposase-like protein